MTTAALLPLSFPMPDGSALGLHVSRFDERQRRLRLQLSKTATCWDYAPLIDVVRREPGVDAHRFTGKTASEWLADLQRRCSPDELRFKRWYESVIERFLETLARRPRVPVLWIHQGMPTIRAIPLYGVAAPDQWFQAQAEPTESITVDFAAGPKGVRHARPS